VPSVPQASPVLARVENLGRGDLVLTHHNRFMAILESRCETYDGDMLEIAVSGSQAPVWITPEHLIAIPAEPLPPFEASVATSRLLRKSATPAETKLWSLLRGQQAGTKFRRQHRMGSFILDFYAPEVRLAVEVDGGVHNATGQVAYDRFRDDIVARHDVRVLRVSNAEVEHDPAEVVQRIVLEAEARRARFDHRIAWRPAGDLKSGTTLFTLGESQLRYVISVRHLQVAETLYALRVSEDGSFVTAAGILRGLK
jgi:very-short-patch-repair endonuclease